jgi:hypothetical protein
VISTARLPAIPDQQSEKLELGGGEREVVAVESRGADSKQWAGRRLIE